MSTVLTTAPPFLSSEVTQTLKSELLTTVQAAHLGSGLGDAVLEALSGPTRVLPEGKASPCAALTFASYASVARGGSIAVIPAVAAMEMLLAAGDLIDDIQDGEAPLPADRHSAGLVLEAVSALLMLCCAAITRSTDRGVAQSRVLRALDILQGLSLAALRGQALDMRLEGRADVTVEDSLGASQLKSASLTRCAAELGAALGSDKPEEIELYARFGWHFGIVTQLMNDIAAVWPGGPDKSDLRLGKKTLPIVFALNLPRDSSRHTEIVRAYYDADREAPPTDDEVKWALWRCGAIHYTWLVAASEKAKAASICRTLYRDSSQRDGPLAKLLN